MGIRLFTNNANTVLDVSISSVALSLQVASGTGALFPNPSGGDYFNVTLGVISAGVESEIEIVKCTARSGDVLTIVRAQEGTTAQTHDAGDFVSLRNTADAYNNPKVDTLEVKNGITGELVSKNQSGGYTGMTLYKINFINAAATFTSFFVNTNTAARTYTFPDATGTIALTSDTINVSNFASQTQKFVLAAPNAANGVPTFRALLASDIPTLNQNTTGTAANVTGIVVGANGGTGVNNGARTISYAGNVSFSGAFASTFTLTATTNVTFPTSGTLLSSASGIAYDSARLGNVLAANYAQLNSPAFTGTATFGGKSLTLGGNLTTSGASSLTLTTTAPTTVTLPTSGNLLSSSTAVAPLTGTPSASTYARGDGTWATLPATSNTWELLSTVTAASSATVDLETGFSTAYDYYVVVGVNIRCDNGVPGGQLSCRIKTNGAYASSGYSYHLSEFDPASTTYAATANASASEINVLNYVHNFSRNSVEVTILAANTSATLSSFPTTVLSRGTQGNTKKGNIGTATSSNGDIVQGIRFIYSLGNIVAGDFYLYGVKNS